MSDHRVVIVGGGFGGLYATRELARAPVQITLVDRRNFHLFQPLLYQVATGVLSPGDIASPLRSIVRNHTNTTVLLGEVREIDPARRVVRLSDGAEIGYDTLVLATGSGHAYFGHDEWAEFAPGLKTVEDASEIRRRVLIAFEAAEREGDVDRQRAWLTFLIVGAGPTGAELAGALGEIAHESLKRDFRRIWPPSAQILLVEATERILPSFPEDLAASAHRALERKGVTVRLNTMVTEVRADGVTLRSGEQTERLATRTVLWAAGVRASSIGRILAEATRAELDRAGRVVVEKDLTVPGHPEIFVVGDLAAASDRRGRPYPGVAPVAIQQGQHVARLIERRLRGDDGVRPFHYVNKGNLATIGRGSAIADLRVVRISGFPAWLAWLFVHILYLVGFENRIVVLLLWAWNSLTRQRGARLITGAPLLPPLSRPEG